MNNKERYQAAFSRLHASETTMQEDKIMLKQRMGSRKWNKCLVASVLTAAALAVTAGAANLATNGELLRKVQLFIDGKPVNVEDYIKVDNKGEEYIEMQDKDGNIIAVSPAPETDEKFIENNNVSFDFRS